MCKQVHPQHYTPQMCSNTIFPLCSDSILGYMFFCSKIYHGTADFILSACTPKSQRCGLR